MCSAMPSRRARMPHVHVSGRKRTMRDCCVFAAAVPPGSAPEPSSFARSTLIGYRIRMLLSIRPVVLVLAMLVACGPGARDGDASGNDALDASDGSPEAASGDAGVGCVGQVAVGGYH